VAARIEESSYPLSKHKYDMIGEISYTWEESKRDEGRKSASGRK
jgi:hypothetical protein